eukprot:Skav211042  [mRNA]  locus=scaffold1434:233329:236413:+ [translate_table: standard]
MQVEPVEAAKLREVRVLVTGIRCVSDQTINKVNEIAFVLPLGLQLCQNGSSHDKVAKVVVVVVVARVAEVRKHAVQNRIGVPCGVVPHAAGQPTPILVIEQATGCSCTLGRHLILGPVENALESLRQPTATQVAFWCGKKFIRQEADHPHLLESFAAEVEIRLEHGLPPSPAQIL